MAERQRTVVPALEAFRENRLFHTIKSEPILETGIEQQTNGAMEIVLRLRLPGYAKPFVTEGFRIVGDGDTRPDYVLTVLFVLLGYVAGRP